MLLVLKTFTTKYVEMDNIVLINMGASSPAESRENLGTTLKIKD
jgi:hypothetical protein